MISEGLIKEFFGPSGGVRRKREFDDVIEAYVGKWEHSGELIEVKASVNYRNPPAARGNFQTVGFEDKMYFKQSRSNPDNAHSPVQLILVRRGSQDLLRRNFETWKWVGE